MHIDSISTVWYPTIDESSSQVYAKNTSVPIMTLLSNGRTIGKKSFFKDKLECVFLINKNIVIHPINIDKSVAITSPIYPKYNCSIASKIILNTTIMMVVIIAKRVFPKAKHVLSPTCLRLIGNTPSK